MNKPYLFPLGLIGLFNCVKFTPEAIAYLATGDTLSAIPSLTVALLLGAVPVLYACFKGA